ncbi:MAG: hypothetical protein LCI00_31330 [Chloroflexi bacterium]|nr:hypothetical protein [Chloroflexota bacterium]MCC6893274.1 hypothetical protein [Anaerolineae bacterium]
MTFKRIILFILFILTVAILGICAWFINLLTVRSNEIEANCTTYLSTPIKPDVVTRLCENGLIPKALANCTSDDIQLTNQDVGAVVKGNIQIGMSSFEDVLVTFNGYITYCSDEAARRNNNFSCEIDISGIGPRATVFFDSATELVTSVTVSGCAWS